MMTYKLSTLASARQAVDAEVANEIQAYRHQAKIEAAARRQDIDSQLHTSVVRTPKPARPSPVGSSSRRKRKVRISSPGLDPSQPISVHSTSSHPSSEAEVSESDADSVMDDASTPRVSLTGTSLPPAPSRAAREPVSSARAPPIEIPPSGAVAPPSDPLLFSVLQEIQSTVKALDFRMRTLERSGPQPTASAPSQPPVLPAPSLPPEIGRASCRERVCLYV